MKIAILFADRPTLGGVKRPSARNLRFSLRFDDGNENPAQRSVVTIGDFVAIRDDVSGQIRFVNPYACKISLSPSLRAKITAALAASDKVKRCCVADMAAGQRKMKRKGKHAPIQTVPLPPEDLEWNDDTAVTLKS